MVVTLPFVLLLLDYWPLGRFQIAEPGDHDYSNTPNAIPSRGPRSLTPRLLLEKVPLLTLSAVSSYMTFYAQEKAGAVKSFELFPLGTRVANALLPMSDISGRPSGLTRLRTSTRTRTRYPL
jgi:hypothetical protein